jgi:hypothetical protein
MDPPMLLKIVAGKIFKAKGVNFYMPVMCCQTGRVQYKFNILDISRNEKHLLVKSMLREADKSMLLLL